MELGEILLEGSTEARFRIIHVPPYNSKNAIRYYIIYKGNILVLYSTKILPHWCQSSDCSVAFVNVEEVICIGDASSLILPFPPKILYAIFKNKS